jgi:hypothetical protein
MQVYGTYSELLINIDYLSEAESQKLFVFFNPAHLNQYMKETIDLIAVEAKKRVMEKIHSFFYRGYSTGALFESIYVKVDGYNITISSTQNYFSILNKGFSPYDLRKSILGKTMKMRLPGGRVIYRKCSPEVKPLSKSRRSAKSLYASNNWVHPGYRGANIYGVVANEMKPWIQNFIKRRIKYLLNIAENKTQSIDTIQSSFTSIQKPQKRK